VLYPPGTTPAERLALYARRFHTAELNASFYHWPRNATFASWRRRLPEGFLLSVKASRGLTHAKRLYAPEPWLERVTACWHELGDRRGVLLVQLAPGHARDDARLDYFLGRGGSYSDADVRWWAERIREWEAGSHDVYAYFNNDSDGHAVHNAETLRSLLGK
jgi:uncharacterized protein YecE (DUF72 family)